MSTPIYNSLFDSRKLSLQEGKNLEREELISWLNSQKKKTVKIEDVVNYLKSKALFDRD